MIRFDMDNMEGGCNFFEICWRGGLLINFKYQLTNTYKWSYITYNYSGSIQLVWIGFFNWRGLKKNFGWAISKKRSTYNYQGYTYKWNSITLNWSSLIQTMWRGELDVIFLKYNWWVGFNLWILKTNLQILTNKAL